MTGNVIPLLHEIRHALQALLDDGRETVIDLRSIPLGPGEEKRIEERLGRGEVQVQLSALGPSELVETRFPGVWLVTHNNNDGDVIGKFIEICLVPRLVSAQQADIRAGLAELNAALD
ncbi:MAG: hydrogenase expression/formation C-terminal domain-containing protein [Gammaproteobacteria bacterium]